MYPFQLTTNLRLHLSTYITTPLPFHGITLLVSLLLLVPLPISLSSIVPTLDNQILRSIIVLARKVRLQDILRALRIPLLRIQTRPRHMRHHCVSTAEGVLGVAKNVVLGRWLREPDVAAVAAEMAGFEGVGDVFFDHYGAAGGVDEPGACSMLVYCPRSILMDDSSYQASSSRSTPC